MIVVAGGGGFIGGHLVGDLRRRSSGRIRSVDVKPFEEWHQIFDDVENLVRLSSERAGHLYGVVYPRYNWFLRAAFRVFNLLLWLRRSPFRVFVHPTDKVEDLVRGNGLERRFYARTPIWQIAVFAR